LLKIFSISKLSILILQNCIIIPLKWARGLGEFGAVVIIAYHPMIASVLIYERFINFGLNYSAPVAALMIVLSIIIFSVIRYLNNKFF
jgi:molybdate/tungstate transport system permease protein